MSRQTNIVSFDAAKRRAQARAQQAPSAPDAGSRPSRSPHRESDPRLRSSRTAGTSASRGAQRGCGAPTEPRLQRRNDPRANLEATRRDYRRSRHEGDAAAEDASQSFAGKLKSKVEKKAKARSKEKAGKQYFRQYEAGKPSDASSSGPRAAVYKGEMGAAHKRSSRMQQEAAATRSGTSARRARAGIRGFFSSTAALVTGTVAAMLLFGVIFLYGPAQQCYTDVREKDRLAAEYEAVQARNEAIDAQVKALRTDAGIEDMARTQFGWVKSGEYSVSVAGLDVEHASDFQGNVVSEDIPFPETWYSGVLDPLFGVQS